MNSSVIIYAIGQLVIYLILGLRYGIFTLSIGSQVFFFLMDLILITFFMVLTQKSPGQFQSMNDTKFGQQTTSLQNFQKNKNIRFQNQNKQFCQLCQLTPNLRSFHCLTCNKCIPTYDHHCGFLGKCIGEKNRQIFYLFCLFQFIQTLIIFVFLVDNLIETGDRSNDKVILLSFILILAFLMGTLLLFESYFMVCNVTMEQFKHKNSKKYTYSNGIIKNLYQFWILGFKKQLLRWDEQTND